LFHYFDDLSIFNSLDISFFTYSFSHNTLLRLGSWWRWGWGFLDFHINWSCILLGSFHLVFELLDSVPESVVFRAWLCKQLLELTNRLDRIDFNFILNLLSSFTKQHGRNGLVNIIEGWWSCNN
jgi:hypothetical protein